MAFLSIISPATDRLISALCNTLLHSLWQGLILAAVTGLIVLFTRKSTAAMRYNLLISALALFAVGVGTTFWLQFGEAKPAVTDVVTTGISNVAVNVPAVNINTSMPTQTFTENLYGYLNQHHNVIVLVWFLIICAKSIQLVVGLIGVRRLKHSKVHQVSIEWHNCMEQLAQSLNIDKGIMLLESGLAKVPMVIGTLKPVILIPIGLLTALTAEEVEAILVHELAHIKRRDYMVNLLQSLMEIVFFFNPAVLWVSQLIKVERENCCDDLALAQSSNKISYIRALVSCEEYKASVPAYAMALAGDRNSLLSRVKRMASNKNHSLNLFEKTVLALCLVVSGLCLSAFAKKAQKEDITNTVAKVIDNIQNQDIDKKDGHATTTQANDLQKEFGQQLSNIITKNFADTHFGEHVANIITKEVAAANIGGHIGKIIAKDLAAARHGENVNDKIARDIAALHLTDRINNKVAKDIAASGINEHLANKITDDIATSHLNERFAAGMAKQVAASVRNLTQPAIDSSKMNLNFNLDSTKIHMAPMHLNLDSMKMHMAPMKIHLDNMKINPKVNVNLDTSKMKYRTQISFNSNINPKGGNVNYGASNAVKYNTNIATKYHPNTNLSGTSTNVTYSAAILDTSRRAKIKAGRKFDMADALYDAHLIKDKKNYKVTLNNKEMVVNGVKQPENVHQSFLKYYAKDPNDVVNITLGVTNSN